MTSSILFSTQFIRIYTILIIIIHEQNNATTNTIILLTLYAKKNPTIQMPRRTYRITTSSTNIAAEESAVKKNTSV